MLHQFGWRWLATAGWSIGLDTALVAAWVRAIVAIICTEDGRNGFLRAAARFHLAPPPLVVGPWRVTSAIRALQGAVSGHSSATNA